MLDAGRHVAHDGGEGARRAIRGGVAHEHAEAVRVALDVVEQAQGRVLQDEARALRGLQGRLQGGDECLHLAVDDDRVQAFLASEMLVDDGLGDLRPGGDLLDAGRAEALFGKQRASHGHQLLAACEAAHSCPLLSHAPSITRGLGPAAWRPPSGRRAAFESARGVQVSSQWTHSALV